MLQNRCSNLNHTVAINKQTRFVNLSALANLGLEVEMTEFGATGLLRTLEVPRFKLLSSFIHSFTLRQNPLHFKEIVLMS